MGTYGQSSIPSLGAASTFALFTAAGAVSNTGPLTAIVGDIGTNIGLYSGFPSGGVTGQTQLANAISAQAAMDVQAAYANLSGLTSPSAAVLPGALGGGQTLTPNLYRSVGATAVGGLLILDAQHDPNAVFIFIVNGALTSGAGAQMVLRNGAIPNHIIWQVNGAAAFAAGTAFAGIIVANGAISFGDGAALQGKGLSTAGAVSTYNNKVTTTNSAPQPLPVILTGFTAKAQPTGDVLQWTTASERKSVYFAVERSTDGRNFLRRGRLAGQGSTGQPHAYTWTDARPTSAAGTLIYYRLRQVDADSTITYSPVREVGESETGGDFLRLQAYPNPCRQQCGLTLETNQAGIVTLRLSNALGHEVAQRTLAVGIGSTVLTLEQAPALAPGLYLLQVRQGRQCQTLRIIQE